MLKLKNQQWRRDVRSMIIPNLYNPFSPNVILYLNLNNFFKVEQFVITILNGKVTWEKKKSMVKAKTHKQKSTDQEQILPF